jgi:hypothetical protein
VPVPANERLPNLKPLWEWQAESLEALAPIKAAVQERLLRDVEKIPPSFLTTAWAICLSKEKEILFAGKEDKAKDGKAQKIGTQINVQINGTKLGRDGLLAKLVDAGLGLPGGNENWNHSKEVVSKSGRSFDDPVSDNCPAQTIVDAELVDDPSPEQPAPISAQSPRKEAGMSPSVHPSVRAKAGGPRKRKPLRTLPVDLQTGGRGSAPGARSESIINPSSPQQTSP